MLKYILAGVLTLSTLLLEGTEVPSCAKWIWGSKTVASQSRTLFMLKININEPVRSAWLRYIADDGAELRLNGQKPKDFFLEQQAMPIAVRQIDLKPLLKRGVNNLLVLVWNKDGVGGLIARGIIVLKSGWTINLTSNRKWLTTMKKVNLDNINPKQHIWEKASILGNASSEPWAHMSEAKRLLILNRKKTRSRK